MDTSDADLRRAFDLTAEAATADRAAVLERLHPGDAALHRRVLAMVAAAEEETFLAGPTMDQPTRPFAASRPAEGDLIGTRVGPYTLVEKVGEGGFGTVFRAEQTAPVARQVAVKVIRLGMDTRQVVARFEQERQALAILDHPNIARVIDAGTTPTGLPFVAMDLVRGDPIGKYCDDRKLDIAARLRLFAQVCAAVQHAHAKGVIHRDIKPTNVLVATADDGAAVAKVIDFGIAKATSARLSDDPVVTERQLFLGTPEYMSPEQAAGAADVDTRADVYSLGALLYELLTGTTPFPGRELRSAALAEVRRMLQEDDPPKPSARLSRSEPATVATAAAARQVSPQRLTTVVRGELDWIVMKALEKDRDRRYATVNGLLADVTRYLNGEVVLAAPPSLAYLVRKAARRHRAAAAAAVAVAASLAVGAGAFAYQARRARAQRDDAITARNAERVARDAATASARQAEGVNAFFSDQILGRANPGRLSTTRPVTLRETVDLAATQVDNHFPDDPLIRATIHLSLGESYRGMGQWKEATAQFDAAYRLRRSSLGPDAPETLDALHRLATTYRMAGNARAAEPLLVELVAARRRTAGEAAAKTCSAMTALGLLYLTQGRPADAVPLLRSAYAGQLKAVGERDMETLQTMDGLAYAYGLLGDLDQAIDLTTRHLALLRATVGEDHPETANALGGLAGYLARRKQFDRSVALYREADGIDRRLLGDDHPSRLNVYASLATALAQSGDAAGAEAIYQDALRVARASPKVDRGTLANLTARHGGTLILARRYAEAESALLDAYPTLRDAYGPANGRTRKAVESLAQLYAAWGRPADAAHWRSLLPSATRPNADP